MSIAVSDVSSSAKAYQAGLVLYNNLAAHLIWMPTQNTS